MDEQKWAEFYRANRSSNSSKVFVKVMTSDERHFFFSDYDDWYKVKRHCEQNSVTIKDLHLQFRSNKVILNIGEKDLCGVYLVRSVMGAIGQKTRHYYTFGRVFEDGSVEKEMWNTPELTMEKDYTDNFSNCFEEAIVKYKEIKHEKAKENQQE